MADAEAGERGGRLRPKCGWSKAFRLSPLSDAEASERLRTPAAGLELVFKLELELTQFRMAKQLLLRGDVDARMCTQQQVKYR